MKINSLEELNALHLDVLTEVGNIGSGNAATALATMLNRPVQIEIPNIVLIHYDRAAEVLGGPDTAAISMRVGLEGDLQGMMLHIMSQEFASNMINTFYRKDFNSLDDVTEMDLSVMQEMSNITTAAYVNSIAKMMDSFINICPPCVEVAPVRNILNMARREIGIPAKQALYIDEKLVIGGTEIKSSMIMSLTLDSLNVMFKRLGIEEYGF